MSETMPAEKKTKKVGPFAILAKIGGKLFSVLVKLFKVLKVGKTALAVGSFATYALLFSWQFALVLMASLFIHECGHIWAMKRYGLKTKGVYFIPFLGAAAVSEDVWPTRRAHLEIAIMGPIWGFLMALGVFVIYLATDAPLAAAIAGWIAMLNLFNLLPVNPLDGGRILAAVGYSISSKLGRVLMGLSILAAFVLAIKLGLMLFYILIPIGALELHFETKRMRTQAVPPMTKRETAAGFIAYLALSGALGGLMFAVAHVPSAAAALGVFMS